MSHATLVAFKLAAALALCWLSWRLRVALVPSERASDELVHKDNAAFAASLAGYWVAVLLAAVGPLAAPGLPAPTAIFWSMLGVAFVNLAARLPRPWALKGVNLDAEIKKENLAAGAVAGGFHAASGLLALGALTGEGGLLPTLVFWAFGQACLELGAAAFPRVLKCSLPAEIKRGNAALAFAAAGAVIGLGNFMRLSVSGDFAGWGPSFAAAASTAFFGLASMLAFGAASGRLLLGGAPVRRELIEQKTPNVGAGFLIGAVWVGLSLAAGLLI